MTSLWPFFAFILESTFHSLLNKMIGETPEVRSDNRFDLIDSLDSTFYIQHWKFEIQRSTFNCM